MSDTVAHDEPKVFGEFENLLGIVRHPVGPNRREDLAVLMLTPGMLHSAGPFRLHVDLADSIAHSGIRSLRFDLSGIGESLAVGSLENSLDRAASEISAAIDCLEQSYSVRKVMLFGLCSGADDAIFAAQKDQRVAAIFAMDGCGYRTYQYYWRRLRSHYLPKMLSPRKWSGLFQRTGLLQSVFGVDASTPPSLQLGTDIREFPTQEAAAVQLRELAQRGVQMHFHYTGGVGDYYNYAEQFTDMLPSLAGHPNVSHSYQPESDHVAFLCEHRQALVKLVCQTVNRFAANIPTADRVQDDPVASRSQTALFPAVSAAETSSECLPIQL